MTDLIHWSQYTLYVQAHLAACGELHLAVSVKSEATHLSLAQIGVKSINPADTKGVLVRKE